MLRFIDGFDINILGLRTIGLAYTDADISDWNEPPESNLTLIGICAIKVSYL